MKSAIKRFTTFFMVCTMIISITGCSLFDSKTKVYSRYVISLLDINYKNESKDYMTLTGVSQKDAEAVYVANMDYQAHNLMNYYGVKEVDDGTILSEFYYLAQAIFKNAKYEVTDVKQNESGSGYTLTLTVYPLNTIDTVYDDIVAYIEDFNTKVDEGDYNNTTEVDYETEFAEGIIGILKKTTDTPGYMDPVVLEIPIQPSDDYYYISDEDFLKINEQILFIRESDGSALPTEDTEDSEDVEDTDSETDNTEEEAPAQ